MSFCNLAFATRLPLLNRIRVLSVRVLSVLRVLLGAHTGRKGRPCPSFDGALRCLAPVDLEDELVDVGRNRARLGVVLKATAGIEAAAKAEKKSLDAGSTFKGA